MFNSIAKTAFNFSNKPPTNSEKPLAQKQRSGLGLPDQASGYLEKLMVQAEDTFGSMNSSRQPNNVIDALGLIENATIPEFQLHGVRASGMMGNRQAEGVNIIYGQQKKATAVKFPDNQLAVWGSVLPAQYVWFCTEQEVKQRLEADSSLTPAQVIARSFLETITAFVGTKKRL